MQFQHPEWFHGFWVVFAGLIFFILVERRKQKLLQKFGNLRTLESLTQSHSRLKERIKKGLLLLILSLLVIALAQPQWGETKKEVQRKGVEIIFLIDTSLSMLAEDVVPSRIEKAKLEMKSFLHELKGDKVGLVTFAGSGFIQSPLTLDYDAFLLFAHAVQVGYIPDAGTSLREAIHTTVKGFAKSKQVNHAAILLSDGEDLEGDVESAVKTARDAKIRIYTIGLGTKEGAPIPLRSEQGKVSGYKKDRAGEIVITKPNEDLLTRIANETGGLYFASTPGGQEVAWIYRHIQNLEKNEFKQKLVVERENHFQLFLALGLALLFIETLLSDAKRK